MFVHKIFVTDFAIIIMTMVSFMYVNVCTDRIHTCTFVVNLCLELLVLFIKHSRYYMYILLHSTHFVNQ